MKTIFISIANFLDPEIKMTVDSAISNARYPERLFFGIFSQVDSTYISFEKSNNIKEEVVDYRTAKGAGYARSMVQKMHSGQDYFLQVDAHSIFVKDWDVKVESLYKKIQEETKNKKVIISFYAKPYFRDKNSNVVFNHVDGNWPINEPHYVKFVEFYQGWLGVRERMPDGIEYHESSCILGGFIFADSSIINEVPYDPNFGWTGEEAMFTIRAYTRGWKIFSPRENLLWHNYERHGNARIWDHNDKWKTLESIAKIRMYEIIINEKDFGIFGIGERKLFKEFIARFCPDLIKKAEKFLAREKMKNRRPH